MSCPICKISWMLEHAELILWVKCVTCGFCKIDREKAARYPYIEDLARHDGSVGPNKPHEPKVPGSDAHLTNNSKLFE